MYDSDFFCLDCDVRFDDRLLYANDRPYDRRPCSGNPAHDAFRRLKRPLKVHAPITPFTDFQWTVFSDCIVTDEVKKSFEATGFTGVRFHPVESFTTGNIPLNQELFELHAVGWGGLAGAKSGIRVVEECPFCGRKEYSIFRNADELLDIDRWDGSDCFIIWPLPLHIIVASAVVEWIRVNRFTGVKWRPISQMDESKSTRSFSPVQLPR